jgi:hypothetical protein
MCRRAGLHFRSDWLRIIGPCVAHRDRLRDRWNNSVNEVESGDFEIYGVVYREDSAAMKSMPFLRGMDARYILQAVDLVDLHLREKLVTPFQSKTERGIDERQY